MGPWKKLLLRAAGVGAGFAVTLSIIIGILLWCSNRPKEWSSNAVTAKWTELIFQQRGEDLHFRFRYALTNHTKGDYVLPSPASGTLMQKLPEDSSLVKLDDARWDDNIRIPPKQTINVVFEVIYKFSDFNTSAAKVYGDKWAADASGLDPTPELMKFVGRRLKEINGMAFLDYTEKYRIELANAWKQAK